MKYIGLFAFIGLFGVGLGAFLPGAVLLSSIQSWIRSSFARKKLKDATSIIAEYDAPNGLLPAEASFIYNGRYTFDTERALLFELQALGAVSLVIQKEQIIFTKVPGIETFDKTYQQMFYQKLQESGTFTKKTFYKIDKGYIATQIRDNLTNQGYMTGHRYTKTMVISCILIALCLAIGIGFLLGKSTTQSTKITGVTYYVNNVKVDHYDNGTAIGFGIIFGFMIFIFGFFQVAYAMNVYYKRLGIPIDATSKLKETWIDMVGYQEYLKTVEQDNLKDDINNNRIPDKKLLAYAVGLNVVNF